MNGRIPKDPTWCRLCIGETENDKLVREPLPCRDHKDPNDLTKFSPYEGSDLYVPSDFVLETVGHQFKGWDGLVYECFGYDPRCGFWMRTVDKEDPRTTCISERAVGGTYHLVRT